MKQYFIRRKSRNKFVLDNAEIGLGYNRIVISKSKNNSFNNPIVKLISNNLKTIVDTTMINSQRLAVELILDTKKEYKLLVKDGLKSQTFDLNFTSIVENTNQVNFTIDEYYKKGKLFFTLRNETELVKDLTLTFEGDLNKTIIWKKGTKEVNVNFVHQIIGFETLKFTINEKPYYKTVINPERFPSVLIKTNEGVKADKYCQYDLVLKTDTSEHVLKGGDSNVILNLDAIKFMKLYFRDKLLFEQYLTKAKFEPVVSIVDSPLRLKLNQPYYEDVTVTMKGMDKKFVIPQGTTTMEIPYKKGLRKFVIESVENAKISKSEFTLLLK
jgi:hypothetical protein